MSGCREWLLNPRLSIEIDGPGLTRVIVRAPTKQGPLRTTVFTDPALVLPIALRSQAAIDAVDPANVELLCAAGVLVRPGDVVRAVQFRAEPWPAKHAPLDGERFGSAWLQRGDALPGAVRGRVGAIESLLSPGPILWTVDVVREILVPAWIDPALLPSVEACLNGADPDPDARSILAALGHWASARAVSRRAGRWRSALQRASLQFRDRGYSVVSAPVPRYIVSALATYVRSLVREGYLPFNDGQSRRYYRHNEPLVRFFHGELASTVAKVVGSEVKPSYCYLAAYEPGAELRPHLDREQCEFSVSMQLDYDPVIRGPSPWPLWLQPTGVPEVPVHLRAGECLVYKGREISHLRHPLPDRHRSISAFFHYVLPDFAGQLS